MKKLFLMFAAVAALFATSCVTDTTSDVAVTGGECDVTLSVVAPGADSRTIGDGLKATKLVCGVYDANWNYLTSVDGNFDGASTTTTLSMRLVKGKTYHFVFWAQNPNAPYTLDLGTVGVASEPIITVDYSNVNANDDNLDAFFGKLTDYPVNGTVNETVYLKRPFAQINFGTSDHLDAKTFGFDVVDDTTATTKVTVTTYTGLSLKSGEIVGNPTEVTFEAAALPEDKTLVTNNGNYYWLAMNYILVPEQDEAVSLAQCDLTVTAQGQTIEVKVPMAPAKRNWRTNLVGSLLTEQGNLTIEIKPIPVDQYVGVVEVGTAEEFNAAFANPEVDFIVLSDNITLTASASRANTALLTVSAGQSLTIDLNNHRLIADSAQLFDVEGTLVIKDGTIDNPNGLIFGADDNIQLSNATVLQLNDPAYYDEEGDKMELIAEGVVKVNETGTEIAVIASCGMSWLDENIDKDEYKGFEGMTIKLGTDVDLSASSWNPIGDNRTDTYFKGTFDGQNHTIKGASKSSFDGSNYGSKEGWGIFSVVDGATIKNLNIDNAVFGSYTVISGAVAGYASDTTFENINITNTKVAGYNWYTGGVVGWAEGECTFKGINLDSTTAVGTLWDSHGQNAGGIAGGISSSANITIEDCTISCVLDVINDVTSNYKWYIYRVAGMIIGNTNTTETKYNEVVTATATNVTCKNVTVNYGQWMNYHYCQGYWNRGWGRVESSDYVGGVDHTQCNHPEGEEHCTCIPFDQLFGGSSNGSGHYPVKGLREFPGVTVNYPAAYTCPTCGETHGK